MEYKTTTNISTFNSPRQNSPHAGTELLFNLAHLGVYANSKFKTRIGQVLAKCDLHGGFNILRGAAGWDTGCPVDTGESGHTMTRLKGSQKLELELLDRDLTKLVILDKAPTFIKVGHMNKIVLLAFITRHQISAT